MHSDAPVYVYSPRTSLHKSVTFIMNNKQTFIFIDHKRFAIKNKMRTLPVYTDISRCVLNNDYLWTRR